MVGNRLKGRKRGRGVELGEGEELKEGGVVSREDVGLSSSFWLSK